MSLQQVALIFFLLTAPLGVDEQLLACIECPPRSTCITVKNVLDLETPYSLNLRPWC